jgi:threonine aldolase
MGGGMRQAGFLAAAGLYALKNNVSRLVEDHAKARELENAFLACNWIESTLPVETNILVVILKDESKRDHYIQKLGELGVKVSAFGPGMIRLVTHLDISPEDVTYTIEQLKKI